MNFEPSVLDGGKSDVPIIRVNAGELHEVVDKAESTLLKSNADIYQHGTRLVRIARSEEKKSDYFDRMDGALIVHDVRKHWLIEQCTRFASWERYDARAKKYVKTDAPAKIAETLLDRCGEWRFPRLTGFIQSPILCPDGRIITKPGHDESTGLYLVRDTIAVPPIADKPSITDACRAVEVLSEIFSTFPFVADSDESATIAALLTGVYRRILPSAPIVAINASTPGTGKSLLAYSISTVVTGRIPSVTAIGGDNTELEKRIDAALLAADPVILIDNVDRAVKSDVLCQIATQSMKTIRELGFSRIVEAPTNLMIMLTGNNLTLLGDLVRRVLRIRLDAGMEQPELRKFERDAVKYALSRRAEALHAVLTISKAYMSAGCPDVDIAPFGSFEEWDRMVRKPLVWTGLPDPLESAKGMREEDHELVSMREFFRVWWDLFRDKPQKASDVISAAQEREPVFSGRGAYVHEDFRNCLSDILGEEKKINSRFLGYRLRAWKDRMLGEFVLTQASTGSTHGVRWTLSKQELNRGSML